MLKSLKTFKAAQGGLAMLEFAFALPFLLLALLGFVELDRYISMTRRLEITANSIAERSNAGRSRRTRWSRRST